MQKYICIIIFNKTVQASKAKLNDFSITVRPVLTDLILPPNGLVIVSVEVRMTCMSMKGDEEHQRELEEVYSMLSEEAVVPAKKKLKKAWMHSGLLHVPPQVRTAYLIISYVRWKNLPTETISYLRVTEVRSLENRS